MQSFFAKLVTTCPSLPYMALGLWLAWSFIVSSGTVWLSDTEINGTNIGVLYIMINSFTGIVCVLASFFSPRVEKFLKRSKAIIGSALITSFGCFVVIIIGPYYLGGIIPSAIIKSAFFIAGAICGIGMAAVVLKCAELYSELSPRRAILYTALSTMLAGVTYFIVISLPTWRPILGGPSLGGTLSFIVLPLIAGVLATLSRLGRHEEARDDFSPQNRGGLSTPLLKLFVVVFVFAVVTVSVRATVVEVSSIAATFDNTRVIMLLRMVMATVFACMAIGMDAERFVFGKIYAVIMACAVALIAFLPIVGVSHFMMNATITLLANIFDFVLWCILAFIVYQKHGSSTKTFGIIYGGYMLGSSIGWIAGAYVLTDFMGTSLELVSLLVLAFVVFGCAFVLFSEKEFDKLFLPKSENESSLDDLLREDIYTSYVNDGKKGKFGQAIEDLSASHKLSKREKDVFRCLAMGYDSAAISKKLSVSWNTVRTHTGNVYNKLGVHSRQELIGLVDALVQKK
ncbi:MAG: helix-turn-helix transcriptional regulator [Actinobacteria bacterium]|nr:helix-turn-helix transcriptional regulator [Actinomycetota bacterium]